MPIIFLSSDTNIIEEWKQRHSIQSSSICEDIDSIVHELENNEDAIFIADYDSVASDINNLISSNTLPENIIVLEREPEITTGKMLISHGAKAYGNSRMLTQHYLQMIQAVIDGKIWTYPALTAKLTETINKASLNNDAKELLERRLSLKEQEVVYLILEGLINDAIASRLGITTRTVKAHISSIFSKLHINDRVSLVLLLK